MIKDNISKIRERIAAACLRTGQDPKEIRIIAVTKSRSTEEIREAVAAGITDIGENKIQEAIIKHDELRTKPAAGGSASGGNYELKWHMVGHLQTNKVKDAVRIFDLIHSVDSLRLAEEIDKQAAKINKVQDILLEVNASGEASKFGLRPDEAVKAIEDIVKLKNIEIRGLMTIAPIVDNPEDARPYFRELKELLSEINNLRAMSYELRTLSMGMTGDFAVAIEEGATMVRIGRAIFEGMTS